MVSVDKILDADIDPNSVDDLLCMSPRQQMCAMDDSFLADLDSIHSRNRRLKRQWECLPVLQPRLEPKSVSLKSATTTVHQSPVLPDESSDLMVRVDFVYVRSPQPALSRTVLRLDNHTNIEAMLMLLRSRLGVSEVSEICSRFKITNKNGKEMNLSETACDLLLTEKYINSF